MARTGCGGEPHETSRCALCSVRDGALIDGEPVTLGGRTYIEVPRVEAFALSTLSLLPASLGILALPMLEAFPHPLAALPVVLLLAAALIAAHAFGTRHVIVVDRDRGALVVSRRRLFRPADHRFYPLDEIIRIRLDGFLERRWWGRRSLGSTERASVALDMEYGETHGLGAAEPWHAGRLARLLHRLVRVPVVETPAAENPPADRWA